MINWLVVIGALLFAALLTSIPYLASRWATRLLPCITIDEFDDWLSRNRKRGSTRVRIVTSKNTTIQLTFDAMTKTLDEKYGSYKPNTWYADGYHTLTMHKGTIIFEQNYT